MSKRRINLQQARRIKQKQTRLQSEQASDSPSTLSQGLVITRFGAQALIEDETGNRLRCSIRPDITSLVAGDTILFQPEGANHGVIVCLNPRQSALFRKSTASTPKPVAANITQIMITLAPTPTPSWSLLDSYLVIAEANHLHACIVLNKTDLPNDSIKHYLNRIYIPLGYTVLYTSKENIAENTTLLGTLNGETSVFVGQSGVGKSSIISQILANDLTIATNAISNSQFGRHTTSNSQLFHLPHGGSLIDSPGVREFKFCDMPVQNIALGFREFKVLDKMCQFRNCSHQNTPNCAIIDAVKKGQISQERYDSYCHLVKTYTD